MLIRFDPEHLSSNMLRPFTRARRVATHFVGLAFVALSDFGILAPTLIYDLPLYELPRERKFLA